MDVYELKKYLREECSEEAEIFVINSGKLIRAEKYDEHKIILIGEEV